MVGCIILYKCDCHKAKSILYKVASHVFLYFLFALSEWD